MLLNVEALEQEAVFSFSQPNDAELGLASQSWLQKNLLLGFPPVSDGSMVRHPEAAVLLKVLMLKCPVWVVI